MLKDMPFNVGLDHRHNSPFLAVDERLCEPRSVPGARRDLALESGTEQLTVIPESNRRIFSLE